MTNQQELIRIAANIVQDAVSEIEFLTVVKVGQDEGLSADDMAKVADIIRTRVTTRIKDVDE